MTAEQVADVESTSELGQPKTVLLLVENDRNRQLLASHLSQSFTIIEPPFDSFEDVTVDLCIVDVASFHGFQTELERKKAREKPTFLPYLLLTEDQSQEQLPDSVWELVDEVVGTPVNKAELDARIENLLQRRALSREPSQQKEQSEERFRVLFQASPDPVVVVTADGTITAVNEAFSRVFAVDPDQVTGRSVTEFDFTPTETVERVLLRVTPEDPSDVDENTVTLDEDGDDSLIMELNADIVTGLGERAERIGIFRDVTERAKQAEELQQQNERLEAFAGTIAHDLQNPLNVALGRLELARETGGDEHFEAVEQAHERMEQLIEEILTLARQGQAVFEPGSSSLKPLVEQAWEHVPTGNASLVREFDDQTLIIADEGRLIELFENLFRNAVEHGGEAVTVRVGLLNDEEGLYVEDDGTGISESERDDIFNAGYSSAAEGTGFGLAIVHQIVEGHDWEITATTGSDDGVRFEITQVEMNT